MRDSEKVTVKIFGQEYTLKGAADPDYVQKVARYVDGRMAEVARCVGASTPAKVAILAAINIADELFRTQEEGLETLVAVEDRSVRLAQLLSEETLLGGDVSVDSEALLADEELRTKEANRD